MIGKNIFNPKRYILIYSILIQGFCHYDMIFNNYRNFLFFGLDKRDKKSPYFLDVFLIYP